VAASLYAIGFLAFAASLPRRPPRLDHPDGIVALTGGVQRLDSAVALFESGVGKRLLITGVNSTTTRAQLKKVVHGGRRFDCCADLGFAAENTHGNAAETAAWTRRHGYRRLLIVTSIYHMPRSLAEFSAEMPGVKLEPWPVEPDGVDMKNWWRDPHALRLLNSEYNKYLASLVLTHVVTEKERNAIDPSLAGRKASGTASAGPS
jgi:uncharacterized SAM-binding protein YcdF (DUF218 family)